MLDRSQKLYNLQGLGLTKGIQSILLTVVTQQVKSGVLDGIQSGIQNGLHNLIQASVTKGYSSPSDTTLLKRAGAATNSTLNSTDISSQLMNSSIEITATFNMLALEPNFTFVQLQLDLDAALMGPSMATLLAALKANITAKTWTTALLPTISSTASSS